MTWYQSSEIEAILDLKEILYQKTKDTNNHKTSMSRMSMFRSPSIRRKLNEAKQPRKNTNLNPIKNSAKWQSLLKWLLSWHFSRQPPEQRLATRNPSRAYNYILHELFADRSHFLAECSREHHHLLLVWRHSENLLDVTSHVWNTCKSMAKF